MIAHTSGFEHALLVTLGCAAVGGYGLAWIRRPSPRWGRLLAWAAAIATVLVATSPPVERLAVDTFTGHMVQHLLLIAVAPPLFVVARPGHVLSALVAPSGRSVSSGRSSSGRSALRFRRCLRWMTARARSSGPLAAPVLFVGCLFVTHLTGLYDLALRNRFVHDIEHIAYLLAAVALWAAVLGVGRASAGSRVLSAFSVIGGSAVLGVVLTSADRPLIEFYVDRLGRDDALADQRLAASLMWVGGMALSLPLLMVAVWSWAADEDRIVRRAETLHDAHDRSPGQVGVRSAVRAPMSTRVPDDHRTS